MTFDLIIRGGSVVDGTGGPARTADVAVQAGRIAEIGKITSRAAREISADGALVTPGWVDVHTHYDGQVTWDKHLAPSSWHGVTTVVMGNCGVGFAPVHDRDHDQLIELMEGVEDIPGTALHEGIAWGWQTFPDYLTVLSGLARDIDFATMVPHSALRLFVMGKRGANREPATPDDIDAMGRLARGAVEAGALGFSTDRLAMHRTSRGEHTPAFGSAHDECVSIAAEMGRSGTGVLQAVLEFDPVEDELELLRSMIKESGRRLSFTLTYRQNDAGRVLNRRILEFMESVNADGQHLVGQVAPRAIGFLYGLQCTLNPFSTNPVFQEIAGLRPEEQARIMGEPGFRQRLLGTEDRLSSTAIGAERVEFFDRMFELADPPDYEPDLTQSIAARAARIGRSPQDLVLDIMVEDGGRGMLYVPGVNYRDGNLDVVGEMLAHRFTIPGLSDGGAHVGTICDASYPTTLLEYWGRDRKRGKLDVPFIVQRQCRDTAWFFGLRDRGVLVPGYRADINVIDFERLRLRRPEVRFDLPTGGRRLLQRAEGYLHTFVSGEETYRDGAPTGQLPGRLVRGARPVAA
jgi:N-acyl-D-aspartate/D-glutamate deacylase